MTARDALAAAFEGLVHNQDDGTESADRALNVLCSLPVEERMEAMGMVEYASVEWDDEQERDVVTPVVDCAPGATLFVEQAWVTA